MLSVVLYGRNDSHGYNLHKRAAISLNAIAELLTDADDEILFVDYNTPDDLPTFPEAIADTLTPKVWERLRILRVRPEIHRARFAAHTHLQALEPIARNAAVRRSNPANRWILSTNTDMIFCPREPGATLSSIVAGLPDGFFHLPRFELPEGLWETLDRKDAPRLISAAATWGERFHLNEITFADRDNVYDAPGDFQLFLREDLFAIGGFHEEMILGWHLDANIAKRMRLLRGKVSSALDHLVGYHCDHTRQASPYHRADRTENDQARFDDAVTGPVVAEQMKTWGLPDVEVEESRLGRASQARYMKGLEASVPGPLAGFLETQYVREDYGRLAYPADHVLPYLLDLMSCLKPGARVGYVGGRSDTFEKFLNGWTAMEGGTINLPDHTPWLTGSGPVVKRMPLRDWIDQSDMFIFEVGAEHAARHIDLTAQESARLWAVDHAFKSVVDADLACQAGGAQPRRAVIINGVHNFFETQVMAEVAVTLTPYSSRVRQGYIIDRAAGRAAAADAPGRAVMRRLHALQPPSKAEIERLGALFARLSAAQPDDPVWDDAARAGAELEAYVAAGLIGPDRGTTELISQLQSRRVSNKIGRTSVVDPAAGEGARNRFVRLEDWDDPDWARLARRLFSNRDHALLYNRDAWTWERVSLTQNLAAALPPEGGAHVLVAGKAPELLAFALARLGYVVDIADPAALAVGELKSVDWRKDFVRDAWVSPQPVGLIEDRAQALADGFRYDAVLLAQNSLFTAGRVAVGDVLRTASGLLKQGGHLGFAALGQPLADDARLQEHALPRSLVADGAFGAALREMGGLTPTGGVDGRLTPRTLDRTAMDLDVASEAPPALVKGSPPDIEVPGVWSFEKTERPADWLALGLVLEGGIYGAASVSGSSAAPSKGTLFSPEDLAQAPQADVAAQLGSHFDSLAPAGALVRTPTALRIPASFGVRLAAVAPLGRLAAGIYELDIDIYVTSVAVAGPALAVAVVSEGRVIAETVLEASRPGAERLLMPLEVGEEGWRGLSVLLKSLGAADCDIQNLALR